MHETMCSVIGLKLKSCMHEIVIHVLLKKSFIWDFVRCEFKLHNVMYCNLNPVSNNWGGHN